MDLSLPKCGRCHVCLTPTQSCSEGRVTCIRGESYSVQFYRSCSGLEKAMRYKLSNWEKVDDDSKMTSSVFAGDLDPPTPDKSSSLRLRLVRLSLCTPTPPHTPKCLQQDSSSDLSAPPLESCALSARPLFASTPMSMHIASSRWKSLSTLT